MEKMMTAEQVIDLAEGKIVYRVSGSTWGQTGAGMPHESTKRTKIPLRRITAASGTVGLDLDGHEMWPQGEVYAVWETKYGYSVYGENGPYELEISTVERPEVEVHLDRENLAWQRVILGR